MAQLLRSQDAYDPIKNVRDWQSQQLDVQPSDYIDEAAEHDEIATLSSSLLSLFKEVVLALSKQANIPKDARISLERSCSALILWSDGFGITQGHLNDTFNKSRKLRHTVLKNLLHIGRVLVERLIPLVDASSEKLRALCSSVESNIEEVAGILTEELCRQSDDSSSDAASTFSDDDIYEIAEDLKTDTFVLSGLDPLLKYPIYDSQHDDTNGDYSISTWAPEKLFSDKIENRFPSADAPLTSHLGKVNYERYLRCQEAREAQEDEELPPVAIQEVQERAGTIIASTKFHDSGVGTSVALTMSYAETTMSYNHDGQSVRIPPLPKEAKTGLPFTCVACGRTVFITSNSAWKRHIYLDLQPYMCLDISCPYSSSTFESREEWISHLALDHEMEPNWQSTECVLCKEETGSGRLTITRHLSKHLEEISLSALPREVDSNAESENSSECDDARSEEPHSIVSSTDFVSRHHLKPPSSQATESSRHDIPAVIPVASWALAVDIVARSDARKQALQAKKGQKVHALDSEADGHDTIRNKDGSNKKTNASTVQKTADDNNTGLSNFDHDSTSIPDDGADEDHEAHQEHSPPDESLSNSKIQPEPMSDDYWIDKDYTLPPMFPRFTCRFCDRTFTRSDNLERHLQQSHSGGTFFDCLYCLERFTKLSDFKSHLDNHPETKNREENNPLKNCINSKGGQTFLATVKAYFKDQPDKFARFRDILADITSTDWIPEAWRRSCQECKLAEVACDAKPPDPCTRCHLKQLSCAVHFAAVSRRPTVDATKRIRQGIINIGQLCGSFPSFIPELNSILPPAYRVEAVDASTVRLITPGNVSTDMKLRVSEHSNDSHHTSPLSEALKNTSPFTNPDEPNKLSKFLQGFLHKSHPTQTGIMNTQELNKSHLDLIEEDKPLLEKGRLLKTDEGAIKQAQNVSNYHTEAPEEDRTTQEDNKLQWISFEYSRDRVKMEYAIRCDVESVNIDGLSPEFKQENCVYPRAFCAKDQYRGNRFIYETDCNRIGWALAQLNISLRGKRGLIQRAVDCWRSSIQDPQLRRQRISSVRQMEQNVSNYRTEAPEEHRTTQQDKIRVTEFQVTTDNKRGPNDLDDLNEPKHCLCNRGSFGDMIRCDNADRCKYKWFHLECVGLSFAPSSTSKWYCPDCRINLGMGEGGVMNPQLLDTKEQIPSVGRIKYSHPNPDIYIWSPDSKLPPGSHLREQAPYSPRPPPLAPPIMRHLQHTESEDVVAAKSGDKFALPASPDTMVSSTSENDPEKRRKRNPPSCLRCHRLKVKCDKELPCGRCKAIGNGRECYYGYTKGSKTGIESDEDQDLIRPLQASSADRLTATGKQSLKPDYPLLDHELFPASSTNTSVIQNDPLNFQARGSADDMDDEEGRATVGDYLQIHRRADGDLHGILRIIEEEGLQEKLKYWAEITRRSIRGYTARTNASEAARESVRERKAEYKGNSTVESGDFASDGVRLAETGSFKETPHLRNSPVAPSMAFAPPISSRLREATTPSEEAQSSMPPPSRSNLAASTSEPTPELHKSTTSQSHDLSADDLDWEDGPRFSFSEPLIYSSSNLPNLEASFMRDFTCCGRNFSSLHALLQHHEIAHRQASTTAGGNSAFNQFGALDIQGSPKMPNSRTAPASGQGSQQLRQQRQMGGLEEGGFDPNIVMHDPVLYTPSQLREVNVGWATKKISQPFSYVDTLPSSANGPPEDGTRREAGDEEDALNFSRAGHEDEAFRGFVKRLAEVTSARPVPGPKPASHDVKFAATVLASLHEGGFDPNIATDDPSFRRRDSRPGAKKSPVMGPVVLERLAEESVPVSPQNDVQRDEP